MYALARWLVAGVFRLVWRPVVVGVEKVPLTGSVIIASNHLSFVDSVVIPMLVPRRVRFLAKAEYFEGPGVKGWLSRVFFGTVVDAVPIRRTGHRDALASLEAGLGVLRAGSAFGLYPEGTRSRDGRLYRGRTGVGWLALESGAPIVPVTLIGTDELQPIGSRLPRLTRIRVVFHDPIDPRPWIDRVAAGGAAGKARREITDRVMESIASSSPQELAGAYNERIPEDAAPS